MENGMRKVLPAEKIPGKQVHRYEPPAFQAEAEVI
jgi:hypothetical protein